MRPPLIQALLIAALAGALHATDAAAQETAATTDTVAAATEEQQAREEYDLGAKAYAAGRYREAIEHFQATQRLVPNPALAYNIALSYDAMGEAASALRFYRDYLRAVPNADDREEVTASIRRLEQRLAEWGVQQLTVTSNPPGATLVIDGRRVGETPWTGELTPGRHKVEATLAGRAPAAVTVSLVDDRSLDVNLELLPASATPPPTAADRQTATHPPRTERHSGQLTRSDAVGIGVFTLGLGSFAAALAFEGSRKTAEEDAMDAPTQVAAAAELDTIAERRRAARIAAGVGAGLVTTGAVVFVLGRRSAGKETSRAPTLTVATDGDSCGLRVSGRLP